MKRDINFTCPVCSKETRDDYMLTNETWKQAGFGLRDNVHLKCVEKILERKLQCADFTVVPVNYQYLKRHGRVKPYTEIGVRRLPCVRCGRPATQQ